MKVFSALILVAVAASAVVAESETLEKQFLDNSQYYFPGTSDNYSSNYPSWLTQPFPVYVPDNGNNYNYYQQPYFGGFQPTPYQSPFFGPGFGGPSGFDNSDYSPLNNMQFSFQFGFRKPKPSFDWASLLQYLNRPVPVPSFGDYWNQPYPVYTIPAPAPTPVTYPNPFTTEVYYPSTTYSYVAPSPARPPTTTPYNYNTTYWPTNYSTTAAPSPGRAPTAYTTTYRPTMYTTTTARNTTYNYNYPSTTYSPLVPMVTNFYGQWVPASGPAGPTTTYSPSVPMVTNFYGQWVPASGPAGK